MNKKIDSVLEQMRFTKCVVEHGVYVKRHNEGKDMMVICLYVDDLLVTGSSLSAIDDFKSTMCAEFETTDLGPLHYFLGMEFKITKAGMVMH